MGKRKTRDDLVVILAAYASGITSPRGGGEYFHVRGQVVPRNSAQNPAETGLTVQCQTHADAYTDEGAALGKSYGWEVGFEPRSSSIVELREAQAMAKLLRPIARKLAQWEDEWGHPTSFGALVTRFCRAIGVEKVKVCIAGDCRDGEEISPSDAAYVADRAVVRFHKEHAAREVA